MFETGLDFTLGKDRLVRETGMHEIPQILEFSHEGMLLAGCKNPMLYAETCFLCVCYSHDKVEFFYSNKNLK